MPYLEFNIVPKYHICLKILLKSVVIIAIAVVVMIGVMVPSVFGEIEVTVTPYKESYHIDEANHIKVKVSKIIPNTDFCTQLIQDGVVKTTMVRQLSNFDTNVSETTEGIQKLKLPNDIETGNYQVRVFYGECNIENSFGDDYAYIFFNKEPSKITKFIQDNYFPEKIDVGTNFLKYGDWNYDPVSCTRIDSYNHIICEKKLLDELESKVAHDMGIITVIIGKTSDDYNYLNFERKHYGGDEPSQKSGFKCFDAHYGWKGASSRYVMSCIQDDIVVITKANGKMPELELFMDVIIEKINLKPIPEYIIEDKSNIASFVDTTKDPQHYIDRYNTEESYKEWFDENYPQYSSIYQAVGLEEPSPEPVVDDEIIFEETTIDERPVQQQSISENSKCPAGEEWIESAEICMMPEPVVDAEHVSELTSNDDLFCGAGTHAENGVCVLDSSTSNESGGGCLIATATYGSELAPQVQQLREIRDNQLLNTESGTAFMNTFNDIYYSFSPIIADYERENPLFKETVKLAITPMISSLSILNYVDMNSESEVLGYGISLIILNLGMYLGIPVVVIVGIRKYKII